MKRYIFILLAILFYFLIFYIWLFNKKLKAKGSSGFIIIVIVYIVLAISDLMFAYLNFNNLLGSEVLRNLLSKTYIILVMYSPIFILNYVVTKLLFNDDKQKTTKLLKNVGFFLLSAAVIDTIVILLLPLNVEIGIADYTIKLTGHAFNAGFVMVIVYLIIIVLILLIYRKKINVWTKICFISCFIFWMAEFGVYHLLYMAGVFDLFNSFILMVIFSIVDNPINKLDLDTGCFLDSYTDYYVEDLIKNDSSFYFATIDIEIINKNKKSEEEVKKARDIYVKKALSNSKNTCFISSYNELTIFTNKVGYLNRIVNDFINQTSLINNIKAKCITFKPNKVKFRDINEFDKIRELANEKVRNSKDNFVKFEINDKVIEDVRNEDFIVEEINKALDEDRIVAYIQPLYSAEEKRIIAAESLTRLIKKDGSIMAPYQYIPIAEKSDQIIKIGDRMFENVCKILTDRKYENLNLDYIDVNLSIVQCEQDDLADKLIMIAQKYRLDPKRINLEITESGVVNSITNIVNNIIRLTDYGFGFSLDDFGTGESNINYLFEMPVLHIKLDNHLIWHYFDDEKAKQTIQAIVKISHFLNLKVVAEGVETEEQFNELIKQGIDYIQGYYFFKPMHPDDYLKIVEEKGK